MFPWRNQARRAALQHTIEKDQPNGYVGVDPGGLSVLPPALHAATHEGGSDPISVLGLNGYPGGTALFLRADKSFASPAGAGTGDVVGPASAVADHVASYNGVTGKLVKDSGLLVADVVVTTDARMTNARTPTAHTHPESDVTNLVTDLAARILTPQDTSVTGVQNDFNLTAHQTYLRCDGAAPIFNGFKVLNATPTAGDRVIIASIGTGTARAGHQETGSTAVYRIIGESVRGQTVGVNGTIALVYDATTTRWRITGYIPGQPIDVPYAAGDYSGEAMTWTVDAGDLKLFTYQQFGSLIRVGLTIETSSTSGTAGGRLWVKLPNGFTVSGANQIGPYGVVYDGGATWLAGTFGTVPVTYTDKFMVNRADFAAFALIANTVYTFGGSWIRID